MRAPEIDAVFGDRALTPNLLGYGENAEYDGDLTLLAQVEFLRKFLHEREIARVHIAGHSIGGAIAMLFARQYPGATESVISIEGNFTLKDAFWSKDIAQMPLGQVEANLEADRADPAAWLARSGVDATHERIAAAESHLQNQSAATMQSMARSVVDITSQPHYLDDVMTVLNNGTRIHLLAGERSRDAWDVPDFVLDNAELTLLENTGHLVTIESPGALARAVREIVKDPAASPTPQ
jgi:pimeloyl-ACP methyl ester carboxylesterase